MKQITLLGATGSIGQSTLDIVRRHPKRFALYALAANTSHRKMLELCQEHQPKFAVMNDLESAQMLEASLVGSDVRVLAGAAGLEQVAAAEDVDIVVAGIVGAAGLMSTLAAVRAGKRILLANKEALVMAGSLFMREVRQFGAELLPLDSEHNAIFQCLPTSSSNGSNTSATPGVDKIILTGSGGPFRDCELEQLEQATPEQACAHPNWKMGQKISVDSATMMNKGLEMIEACWLFSVQPNDIEIVLHRQSVVHSMVAYVDGSVIAQLGNPDMRTPIANALGWPDRIESGVEPLNLIEVSRLDFSAADNNRYPCLRLAIEAWNRGGTSMAILNAANEVAVENFLNRKIKFTDIAWVIEEVLQQIDSQSAENLDFILQADLAARECATSLCANQPIRLQAQ